MRSPDDSRPIPQNTRRTELASIFAAAILRLHARCALAEPNDSGNSQTCLELSDENVLSVQNG